MLLAVCGCARSAVKTSVRQHKDSGATGFSLRQNELTMPRERIYFPFASDYIMPEAEVSIRQNIEWMLANSNAYIILEGHCDEVGDKEFNMELGDKRARAVKAYMIAQNIPADRIIMVVSFGSTRPLNLGHRVEDLRENRRVEFVIR